ncbi:MAG: uncharacterized protein JWQ48_2027 [Conexibacter sp.]|nr:uncharacterized protein [Conexibacter sp.]
MRSIRREDTPVVVEGDGVELRTTPIGGELSVAFVRLPAGADLGPGLKGMPNDLCPCPHWGYMLSGRLKMRTEDGDKVYEAGDAFYWGPGHAPAALDDCEYVDFSPTHQFKEVLDHLTSGAAASA